MKICLASVVVRGMLGKQRFLLDFQANYLSVYRCVFDFFLLCVRTQLL